MNDIVRVGVIGTGAMGSAHVDTLAHWVAGARVAGVYDADTDRAAQVAASVDGTAYASADELIADVDAVLVAAPDPLHEELALACLAAGRPTLLEKPLATSIEGSRKVVESEVAGGRRLLQLGFMRRYDPAYVALREAALGGRVGELRAMHCLHRNAQAHPSATSAGVLVNSMIHEFDSVPWLLDDPLTAVTVHAPRVAEGALQDVQVAVLETAAGRVVTVEVSVNARYGYDVHTEITGTEGTVSLTPPYGIGFRRGNVDGRYVDPDGSVRFADAYRVELGAWLGGVREGRAVSPSAWDGYLANLAAFAAVESLHGAGRVMIERPERPELYST